MATTLVTGEIVLPAGTPSFSGATVTVSLENTGLLDMPAQLVSEEVMRNVAYDGSPLTFALAGEEPQAGGQYHMRAHVSVDGSDDISKGDYITKRAYRVLRDGAPDNVRLELEAV